MKTVAFKDAARNNLPESVRTDPSTSSEQGTPSGVSKPQPAVVEGFDTPQAYLVRNPVEGSARTGGVWGLTNSESHSEPSPRLALGIGCDRGTPTGTLARTVAEALVLAQAEFSDVVAVASITLKADEPGLLALAAQHGWAITFYRPEQLAAVSVPNPSETVRRYTGTPSVSEAAALLAAGTDVSNLLVEKHKLRDADGKNATVSVARCAPDFISPLSRP
jgi:cobalt-precorrin 5A hydrolase